jgi:hypothetical protein
MEYVGLCTTSRGSLDNQIYGAAGISERWPAQIQNMQTTTTPVHRCLVYWSYILQYLTVPLFKPKNVRATSVRLPVATGSVIITSAFYFNEHYTVL